MNVKFLEKEFYPEILENCDIEEMVVCKSCVGSLASFFKFVAVCATTEEEISKYCRKIDTNGQDLVELNHIRMFRNENERKYLKKRTLSRKVGNKETHLKGITKETLHYLVHKDSTEMEMHACEMCDFKTKWKRLLKTHLSVHKGNSEVTYQCAICHYKTNQEDSLKTHSLIHKEQSEMEMYKCEKCDFKTKHKRNLKSHLLVHREYSEVEMYECEKCHFKTKLKRENSEMEMYECETCHFKTKHTSSLKKHLIVHKPNSEVEMYECERCNFKTKRKDHLKRHSVVHRENS
ncbi:hypothetical protein NQ317_001924 [Molorchus minor]|uniref:Protein hunchback n=1 Tax=Molorchus minor TaxID=1323400 RepID=A0ABQ9JDM0_9CUCU|nr:hypothetical protein NQ317_001924 [Molorchus minor]